MKKLNCIAIDDEPLALNIIKKYVTDIPELNLITSCSDAIEGMAILKKDKIDLIFLDINMPKLSGISFLKATKNPPLVIFTTAYSEYAIEGFELEAVDYLLKPFSFERFLKAVNKAVEQFELVQTKDVKQPDHVFIKSDKRLFRVLLDDIKYLEAYGDYVKVYTRNKMLLTKQKLSVMYQELPAAQFVQIHRSYVLSIKHIEFLEGNLVQVGGNKLPISTGNRDAVFKVLNK